MKMSEILEAKVEMCPDACCGKPVTECSCGPDCKHCDCYEKNKAMNETTSAGSVASVANPSTSRKKPKKNRGVAPNALDSGDNLMGGKTVRR